MGSGKWIAGFLGWVFAGPIGALLGFLAGSLLESDREIPSQSSGSSRSSRDYNSNTGGYSGSRTGSRTNTGGATRQNSGAGYTANQQRNSFFVSLLVLSSAVVRADGKTDKAELDVVRNYIRVNFGESAAQEAMRVMQELGRKEINVYSVGTQIADNMNYSQRLQLFQYLNGIAIADGNFTKAEKDVLESIASALRLSTSDSASIISMYYKQSDDTAYSILEISPTATDDEVKTAYRRMAMKYHPDKVATLGPEVQKAAAEKFRKVQEAYESIKKQRGMS